MFHGTMMHDGFQVNTLATSSYIRKEAAVEMSLAFGVLFPLVYVRLWGLDFNLKFRIICRSPLHIFADMGP